MARDIVYLLDNSDNINPALKSLKNIVYVPYCENKGIAFALEDALSRSIRDNCDFLLTLDQDSVYQLDQHNSIVKRLQKIDFRKDAIFALATLDEFQKNKNRDDEHVTNAITSGNFLNISCLRNNGIHFPVELFIDYVDFEFDRRILEKNLNIIQSYAFFIEHKIGQPIKKNILGIKFTCMNHSPIRYYYRYRNAYYLKKKYPKFYKKLALKTLFIDKIKMNLFDDNKKEKRLMIKTAIRDAKAGKLGTFNK